jgi:hypothetical protein
MEVFMKTTLCHMLGIEHPIIAALRGPDLTGLDFVVARCNAGGLGILQVQLCPSPRGRVRPQVGRGEAADHGTGMRFPLRTSVTEHVDLCEATGAFSYVPYAGAGRSGLVLLSEGRRAKSQVHLRAARALAARPPRTR